jgi:hypothetical protein
MLINVNLEINYMIFRRLHIAFVLMFNKKMLKSVVCPLTDHNNIVVFLCSVWGQTTGGDCDSRRNNDAIPEFTFIKFYFPFKHFKRLVKAKQNFLLRFLSDKLS